jgi:hypothetical protein
MLCTMFGSRRLEVRDERRGVPDSSIAAIDCEALPRVTRALSILF